MSALNYLVLFSFKIYDKRDDFDIVNFPFLDGDVSQLITFSRVCNHERVK